jgi:hypothetical protein
MSAEAVRNKTVENLTTRTGTCMSGYSNHHEQMERYEGKDSKGKSVHLLETAESKGSNKRRIYTKIRKNNHSS